MSDFWKSIALRFARVFVAAAIAQMVIVAIQTQSVSSWEDFSKWCIALSVAGIAGGLTALDKALRS